jgi:hypothetical protein
MFCSLKKTSTNCKSIWFRHPTYIRSSFPVFKTFSSAACFQKTFGFKIKKMSLKLITVTFIRIEARLIKKVFKIIENSNVLILNGLLGQSEKCSNSLMRNRVKKLLHRNLNLLYQRLWQSFVYLYVRSI